MSDSISARIEYIKLVQIYPKESHTFAMLMSVLRTGLRRSRDVTTQYIGLVQIYNIPLIILSKQEVVYQCYQSFLVDVSQWFIDSTPLQLYRATATLYERLRTVRETVSSLCRCQLSSDLSIMSTDEDEDSGKYRYSKAALVFVNVIFCVSTELRRTNCKFAPRSN